MSELAYNVAPGFFDLQNSDIAQDKAFTDVHAQTISRNAKWGAVRQETFFLGYFTHGAIAGMYASGAPIISPVDGYNYNFVLEVKFVYEIFTNRAPGSPFVNGQLSVPPISAGQASNIFWIRADIADDGTVTMEVNYDNSTTPSHDGILKVFAICQRVMPMITPSPTFTDVVEGLLCVDQPIRQTIIQAVNDNAKFGAIRQELFDLGFWAGASILPLSVSPIDSYAYARSETRYLLVLYSTLRPSGSLINGQSTRPTLGNGQMSRRTSGPLYWWLIDSNDDTGFIQTAISYYVQDGAETIFNGDGVFRVFAMCQRQSTHDDLNLPGSTSAVSSGVGSIGASSGSSFDGGTP